MEIMAAIQHFLLLPLLVVEPVVAILHLLEMAVVEAAVGLAQAHLG
jgi:hypothetical protein